MDLGAPASSGLAGSLRGLLDDVFGSVCDRAELLSIELQEEKHRLIQTFAWIVAFGCAALLALLFVSGAIIAVFWHTPYRLTAVVGLAALYTVATVAAGLRLKRCLEQPRPFAATIEALRADRECLRPKN